MQSTATSIKQNIGRVTRSWSESCGFESQPMLDGNNGKAMAGQITWLFTFLIIVIIVYDIQRKSLNVISWCYIISVQCFQPQQVFYNSVNVITFGMVKSDHIKRLLVFFNAKFVTIAFVDAHIMGLWNDFFFHFILRLQKCTKKSMVLICLLTDVMQVRRQFEWKLFNSHSELTIFCQMKKMITLTSVLFLSSNLWNIRHGKGRKKFFPIQSFLLYT